MLWKCLRCNENIDKTWDLISRKRTPICKCRKPESKEVKKLRELDRTSGCKLITPFEDYTDVQQDLMWKCPFHNDGKAFPRKLNLINRYGFVCRECAGAQDTRKLTIERVRTHCQYSGYDLDESSPVTFENNRSLVPVICLFCNVHSRYQIAALSQGQPCKTCNKLQTCDKYIKGIKSMLEAKGGKLVDASNIVDRDSKVKALCQNGHEFKPSHKSLTDKYWCKYCVPHKFTYEEVLEMVEAKNWTLVSKEVS